MIVLLLGSGGREHALAWKIAQSPLVEKIYALPGSDGIASIEKVECVAGDANEPDAVLRVAYSLSRSAGEGRGEGVFQNEKQIVINNHPHPAQAKPTPPSPAKQEREQGEMLIVIGPEKPLETGVSDVLEKAGFVVCAPSQAAAQLETSKIFSKTFMVAEGIPTAPFTVCHSYDDAMAALKTWDVENKGVVIKADGLAAGKGVAVTNDRTLAEKTAYDFMRNPACTVRSEKILLEEKIAGKEVSAFALCDGETFIPLGYACDYKRVGDGDQGANTGGMGGYAPEGWPSERHRAFVNENIFKKTVAGMKSNGTPYKGVLYAGLMIDGDRVNVIEFNTRFGDPEAQILLPLIDEDIVPLFQKAAAGTLSSVKNISFKPSSAVHVVMVSGGYPDAFGTGMQLGEEISLPQDWRDDTLLFIAGAKKKNGTWVNHGGRVLGITALGVDMTAARESAYNVINKIHFNGAHWRKDIGR